jgi:uncharacterized protein DUF4174
MRIEKYVFYLLLFLFPMKNISGQSLDEHLWKDRVLLIFSSDFQSEKGRNQFTILNKDEEGLKDRKVVVYQITPEKMKKGAVLSDDSDFIEKMYQRFSISKDTFMVVLIGLDGGEKLKQSALLTKEELFAIIDGMPMRRNELRRKNSNK